MEALSYPHRHVIEKVQKIVARRLGVELTRVNGMLFFLDDYGADDDDVAAIIAEVEREFGIRLPRDRRYDVVGELSLRVVDALAVKGRSQGRNLKGWQW